MDAKRNLLVAFAVRKLQIETLGDSEIHLICHQREFSAYGTPNLYINFWTIERGFIFGFHVRYITSVHCTTNHLFRLEPQSFIIYIFFAKAGLAMQR